MAGPKRKIVLPPAARARTAGGRKLGYRPLPIICAYECRLSVNTVAAYERDLRRFREWLAGRTIAGLEIRDLADYVAWLGTQKLAPASVARHIISLRMLFRYLQLEGLLSENKAELLGSPKLWQRIPQVLSPQAIAKLFEAPSSGDLNWRRDRVLLELLYATGCRASELSFIRLRDLQLDEGYCRTVGKGNKERLLPLGGRAIAAIREYLEREPPLSSWEIARRHHRLAAIVATWPAAATRTHLGTRKTLRGPHWRGRRHESPHVASQFRDTFIGGRSRFAASARTARPREHCHHPNLHACRPAPAEGSPHAISSTGVRVCQRGDPSQVGQRRADCATSATVMAGLVAD